MALAEEEAAGGRDMAGHAVDQKNLSADVQGGGKALEAPLKSQQEASAQTGTTELALKVPKAEEAKAHGQLGGLGVSAVREAVEDTGAEAADTGPVCLSAPND